MSVINTTRNYVDVFEAMVEYALFPPDAVYSTFPDSRFAASQRFKGRPSFVKQGAIGNMPWILWIANDAPDISDDESAGADRITGTVTIMIAHAHPDQSVAYAWVKRDVGLAREVLHGQMRETTLLPSGPFWRLNTSVVPASFGTVLEIDTPGFIEIPPRPSEELGSGVVTGGVGVVIPMLVDATN